MHLNCLHSIVSTNKGILVISSQYVKKMAKDTFTVISQDDKDAVINIESVLRLRLPCHLSRSPLKRDLLDIYLSTFFVVNNFAKT